MSNKFVTEKIDTELDTQEGIFAYNGSATYDSGRIRLTSESTSESGNVKFRGSLGEADWRTSFRMDIENQSGGSADQTNVLFYHDTANNGAEPVNGYLIGFDHWDDKIRFQYYKDSQVREEVTQDFTIPDEGLNKHNVRVRYDHGDITVWFNNEPVFTHTVKTPDYSYDGFGFGAWTGSEDAAHYVDNITLLTPTDRNISEAESQWDNDGITFHENSNVYKLMRGLLSEADRQDMHLYDIKRAHHIETAKGEELDKIGKLVQLDRKDGESDDKYRARLKVQFRVGNIGTTFDEFSEFTSVLLDTNVRNIEFSFNYEAEPGTVTVATDPQVYDSAALTRNEVAKFLGRAVPAGHRAKALERGSFRLKVDGETDDASKGLTSDSTSGGGTLAADIV